MDSFIGQALVFMSAAVLMVPLFQRLGFGSVLGYLIAGVLVGPHGLRFIQDPESIVHFSEFGVVFLLFIIGLEIQPRKLWLMRRHLVGLGGLQILICSLAFTGIAWAIGLPPKAAGIVGFALSLSSTAFVVQNLVETNTFNTEFGRSSFSILLMQDLVAIPALAVIPLLAVVPAANDGSKMSTWIALPIVAGLIFASRYLIRPIFRIIAETRSREVFTAVTLFIATGVAALMELVGLSAALGAFIAGVLLADSEYRHELESDIEPFKGLLMGLFFIGVGMNVSVELVTAQPLMILGLAVGYLLLKAVLIYLVSRIFNMNHRNSKLVGLSVAQGGEFAFVIFGIAAQVALLESKPLAILTAVITLSMALSPLLNMAHEMISRAIERRLEPQYDEIQNDGADVIIAGFGRFGQIFGRVLRAQDIPFVAIDHDPDQIELLRKFGNTVYYGDVSRKDLLIAAGAERAKYFILAIDDVEASLATVKIIKENFPNLTVYARARNRGHVYDLMELDVSHIKREMFDSSAAFVRDFLVDMGMERPKANLIIEKFKEHDEIMMLEQFKYRTDDDQLISVSKRGTAQLAQVLSDDNLQSHIVLPGTDTNKEGSEASL